MRAGRITALAATTLLIGGAAALPALGAEGDTVLFSPTPAPPGATVTLSITGDNVCGNFGNSWDSHVTLTGPASYPPIPFDGNPATFVVPADAPLGLYNAQVNCATSANTASGYAASLFVGTALLDEPPLPNSPIDEPTAATAGSTVAANALVAAPTQTG